MEFVNLNNGIKMPVLGFGVYQIPEAETKQAVLEAITVGYRLIDTAQSYFNEAAVGEAIAETAVPRSELFITTKVWIDNFGYEKTRASVLTSMEKLQVEYIDLVLLHQALSDYYGAYRALEELYEEGKIRAIGVSNFNPNRVADLAAFNRVTPQVNQIEINPFHQQVAEQENLVERHIQAEAWAPFGEGKMGIFEDPILTEIGHKYRKSSAQVILRWLIQRQIVVLAKSVHKTRMAENFDVFDFHLSSADMESIKTLDKKESMFFDFADPKTVDRFVELIEVRKNRRN